MGNYREAFNERLEPQIDVPHMGHQKETLRRIKADIHEAVNKDDWESVNSLSYIAAIYSEVFELDLV